MKPIAVTGCALMVQAPSSGDAKITSPAATNVMVDNKSAYFGTIMISVSNASDGVATNGTGVGTLSGTSKNCTNNNQPAVLEGDSAEISVTGDIKTPPYTKTWKLTVKITNAGQTSSTAD